MIHQSRLQIWLFATICSSISICHVTSVCINYEPMSDLDLEKLKGTWWEYQTFNSQNQNEPHDCLVANFYPKRESLTIIEDFISIKLRRDETKHTRREYSVYQKYNKSKGMLAGLLPSETGDLQSVDYTVIYTDYDHWLLVHMCGTDPPINGGLVLTRGKWVKQSLDERIEHILRLKLQGTDSGSTRRHTYTTIQNEKCNDVHFPAI